MDATEFERLVREYRDRVFGFAIHFLGDRAEAEDVTQDVFVRLWKNRFDVDRDAVQPWLFRVARNACVDVYRRQRMQRNVISSGEDVAQAVSADQRPDEWAEQKLFEEHLAVALEALTEPQRSIVILRELQGLKYGEICETLGLPMATVKVYLHRGRRVLRQQLNDVYHAQPIS